MSEFLQPVPRSVLFDLLQAKLREVREESGKLPRRFCVVSYLLDMQSQQGPKTQSDYARIWGWSKGWVSKHIDDIAAEAEAQRTFYNAENDETERERDLNAARTPAERSVNADPPTDDTDPEKTANRERNLNADETERERDLKTNRSHYSNYQSKEDEDDAAPAREGTSFHEFLDEEQRGLYLDDLRDLIEKYPSAESCDLVWTKTIQTRRGPSAQRPIPRRWLINRAEEHGWPRLLAALWITSQKADKPNQNYARRILTSFDEDSDGNHRPQSRGHDRRNGRGGNRGRDPASDFEHNRRLAERAFAD
jgi:hypothetical protein